MLTDGGPAMASPRQPSYSPLPAGRGAATVGAALPGRGVAANEGLCMCAYAPLPATSTPAAAGVGRWLVLQIHHNPMRNILLQIHIL